MVNIFWLCFTLSFQSKEDKSNIIQINSSVSSVCVRLMDMRWINYTVFLSLMETDVVFAFFDWCVFPLFLWPFVCVCVYMFIIFLKWNISENMILEVFVCLNKAEVRWWLHGGILRVLYIRNVSEQSRKAHVNRHLLHNLCSASPALSQLSDDVELRNTDNPKHFKTIYNTH